MRVERQTRDVLRQHRLADVVLTDQQEIVGVAEELERHQRFNGDTVAPLGLTPLEVADRLETADQRIL